MSDFVSDISSFSSGVSTKSEIYCEFHNQCIKHVAERAIILFDTSINKMLIKLPELSYYEYIAYSSLEFIS